MTSRSSRERRRLKLFLRNYTFLLCFVCWTIVPASCDPVNNNNNREGKQISFGFNPLYRDVRSHADENRRDNFKPLHLHSTGLITEHEVTNTRDALESHSYFPSSRLRRAHYYHNNDGGSGEPRRKTHRRRRKKGSSSTTTTTTSTKTASKSKKKSSSTKSVSRNLNKYNQYMDVVLRRMNLMIKEKKMDPLKVNLYAGKADQDESTKSTETKTNRRKGNNNKKNKKNRRRNNGRFLHDDDLKDDHHGKRESEEDRDIDEPLMLDQFQGVATRDIFLNQFSNTESGRRIRGLLESLTESTEDSEDPSPSNRRRSRKRKNRTNKKDGKPTKGVLFGLSSLRRDGNVQVIRKGKARIVRTKFFLGPVSLHIFPKTKKRAGREESRKIKAAATAVAPELKGVLEIRLKRGSSTRIRRLRVFPPAGIKVKNNGKSQSTDHSNNHIVHDEEDGSDGRQYRKVTPMATNRLRRIAAKVVRETSEVRH